MDKPLVTIGLPFYNCEETLLFAINSILLQTYENWELILVNDGSKDRSVGVAESIVKVDKRIHFYNDGINRGLIYRLNQIADLTTTRYLARMDGDDMMLPDKLERQIDFLEKNPEVDIVDTAIYTIDENLKPVGYRYIEPIKYDKKEVLKKAMLTHATIVGKTEWFRRNRYDSNYIRAEDYELWCRTFNFSNFKRINFPLYIVREGSVNIKNYKTSLRTVRKILIKYAPETLSRSELVLEIFKTYAKTTVYTIAGVFHLQHHLSARRNKPLNKSTKARVRQIIATIKTASLTSSAAVLEPNAQTE